MPGGDHRAAHRQQMEGVRHSAAARSAVALQRASALHSRHQQKSLTENLRQLEADEIVVRTVYPEVPPRVEYCLSEVGESMRPIIASMAAWGTQYQRLVRRESDA